MQTPNDVAIQTRPKTFENMNQKNKDFTKQNKQKNPISHRPLSQRQKVPDMGMGQGLRVHQKGDTQILKSSGKPGQGPPLLEIDFFWGGG